MGRRKYILSFEPELEAACLDGEGKIWVQLTPEIVEEGSKWSPKSLVKILRQYQNRKIVVRIPR